MKVAVQCESPLLQRSLELFLAGHLSSLKQCDIVIRDKRIDDGRNALLVDSSDDADLQKPFSRSQLFLTLENRLEGTKSVEAIMELADELHEVQEMSEPEHSATDGKMDFSVLEKRIEKLTQEYQENVIKAVRAFYEG